MFFYLESFNDLEKFSDSFPASNPVDKTKSKEYNTVVYSVTHRHANIIEDMQRGGNYYQEITPEEYELFRKEGWRKAVFQIALKKYQDKVNKINESIQKEANSKKNQRSLQLYQEDRHRQFSDTILTQCVLLLLGRVLVCC